MDAQKIIQQLELLATELKIIVRYEPFEGEGGLCKIDNNYHIIINQKSDQSNRIRLLAKALSRQPIENVFMPPEIREILNKYSATGISL